jgi:hypothetical protein
MTTRPKALEALTKYFDITERADQYEIRCKVSRKGWVLPFRKWRISTGFNHAFAQGDEGRTVL